MSFTLEFAASLVRSPSKNRRRPAEGEEDHDGGSPTRVLDFPMDDETIEEERSIDIDMVNDLSMAPLDGDSTSGEITPIDFSARRRFRKITVLPTLNEQSDFCNDLMDDSTVPCFNIYTPKSPTKSKKKGAQIPRPTRAERIQECMNQAAESAGTGDEEEGIKLNDRAYRMADSEINKLKIDLYKSLDKHPDTLQSIQTRIQEDLLHVALQAAKIKTILCLIYEREGDYDSAIELCKEAKSIYKKQRKRNPGRPLLPDWTASPGGSLHSSGSDNSERSIVWYVSCPDLDNYIKENNQLLNRLVKAQDSFENRKKTIEDILLLHQEIANTADTRQRKKLYAKAESMAKSALATEQATLGKNHPQVADTLQLLSALALEQQNEKPENRAEALQYLLRALELHTIGLGPKHPRTGQDLLRLARLYQQTPVLGVAPDVSANRNDEDRAIEYFEQAIEVFRAVKGGHKVVGSIQNDLAVIQVARRDYTKALELLNESMSSYKSQDEDSGDDVGTTFAEMCIDVVQVWRNMGECHMNLKDYEHAIECFTAALDVQREARRRHDSGSCSDSSDLESAGEEKFSFLVHLIQMISDESLADTLRRLGKAFCAAEKYKEALVVYKEAHQIHRAALQQKSIPGRRAPLEIAAKQDQFANTLYCIAEVYDATKNYTAAVKLFNESMQMRMTSDGHRPESQRCNMVHCAMCLVGVANIHFKKGEFVDAHKLYNNALFFCEAQGIPFDHAIVKMIESRRRTAEKQITEDPNRDVELVRLQQRAECERLGGEFDQAIRTLSEALAIRQASIQKLKAADLDLTADVAATAELLHACGHVFSEKGDTEKAQRAHQDAIQLRRQYAPAASA